MVLVWVVDTEKIEKVRVEESSFRGGVKGCFREATNHSDSVAKITDKGP